MTEIRAKQCSLTLLLISQSFLNRFGCFWARFKRGGLENPYPYPYPCLPACLTRAGSITRNNLYPQVDISSSSATVTSQEPVSTTLHQKSASATLCQIPTSGTPRQRPVAPSQNPVAVNSKKCISLTDNDIHEDHQTLAPPLKKTWVNRNAHERNSKKPQAQAKPLCRSGNVSPFNLKCQYENHPTRNINI